MVEDHEIFREVCGYHKSQHTDNSKKQSGSPADRPWNYQSDICLQKPQKGHADKSRDDADPPQHQRPNKQTSDVLHMGDLPVIEKFPGLSIHDGRNV